MALLSAPDLERIERMIAAVERRTAGELVVMLVPSSARYDLPRALVSSVWTVALALAVALWSPWAVAVQWILLAQLPVAAALWAALGLRPLRRALVPRHEAAAAVHARAIQAFGERGIDRTRDRSGILLFVSELEQRVEILGDSGIHERVGTEGWSAHIQTIVTAIRAGRAADGIIEVLEALGEVLARDFPPRPDDTNELPDRVIQQGCPTA